MSGPRLVMVGGMLVDVVMYVPHLPAPGGDVLASDAVVSTGAGFNVLAAASRQGLATAYLGPHGTGRFGDQVRADLAREGIAVTRAASPESDSGFCIGLVDEAAEATYATRFGSRAGSPSRCWTTWGSRRTTPSTSPATTSRTRTARSSGRASRGWEPRT